MRTYTPEEISKMQFSFAEYPVQGTSLRDCHSAIEISLFKCDGVYTIDGKDYDFHENSIFLMPGNITHAVTKVTRNGTLWNIRFEPRFIWGSANSFDRHYIDIFLCAENDFAPRLDENNPVYGELVDLIYRIKDEYERKETAYEHISKALLLLILSNIYRHYTYDADTKNIVQPHNVAAVSRAVDYMDEHFAEQITLDGIAKAANLSTSYFGVMFKKLNGITPWEYITSKRIKKAAEMLLAMQNISMTELADSCGFNNVTNFNRMFKKYTGVIPSRYSTTYMSSNPIGE